MALLTLTFCVVVVEERRDSNLGLRVTPYSSPVCPHCPIVRGNQANLFAGQVPTLLLPTQVPKCALVSDDDQAGKRIEGSTPTSHTIGILQRSYLPADPALARSDSLRMPPCTALHQHTDALPLPCLKTAIDATGLLVGTQTTEALIAQRVAIAAPTEAPTIQVTETDIETQEPPLPARTTSPPLIDHSPSPAQLHKT